MAANGPKNDPPYVSGMRLPRCRKLIAVSAFNRNRDGQLLPTIAPLRQHSLQHAVWLARALMRKYDGVIAWSREFDPILGDWGPPTTLYMHGDLPDGY